LNIGGSEGVGGKSCKPVSFEQRKKKKNNKSGRLKVQICFKSKKPVGKGEIGNIPSKSQLAALSGNRSVFHTGGKRGGGRKTSPRKGWTPGREEK